MTDAELNRTHYQYYTSAEGAHLSGLRKTETRPKGITGYEDAPWEVLTNNFVVLSGTLTVQLLASSTLGEFVTLDAIRIDRMDRDGVFTRIIDDVNGVDKNFRTDRPDRTAYQSPFAYGDDYFIQFATDESGSPAATWTFRDLLPGTYRISATWQGGHPFDATATYHAFDGLPGGASPVNS